MEIPRRSLLAGLTLLPGASAQAAGEPVAPPPLLFDWHDAARSRDVPALVRLPAGRAPNVPAPVVIISHGLGGTREGLAYLGQAMADAGFVAIHLQHHGSDIAVWRGATNVGLNMAAALLDVRNALDRLRDIPFVLDLLPDVPALRGRLDFGRMAIAGHSFGAWTVTHMLGERLPSFSLPSFNLPNLNIPGFSLPALNVGGGASGDWGLKLPDPRLRAGIALSPVPPLGIAVDRAYDRVRAPILHITGTEDRGYIEAATPEDRTIPFRHIPGPGVLAVLAGAGHSSFAGEPGISPRFNEPTYQQRTGALSVLFLRALLQRDAAARALLLRGAPLERGDRIESRNMDDA